MIAQPKPSTTTSAAPAPTAAASGRYSWRNVPIAGGGFVTGFVFNPSRKDLLYSRTDMGGAYRWDAKAGRWIPLTDWAGDWNLLGIESVATDPVDEHRRSSRLQPTLVVEGRPGNGRARVPARLRHRRRPVPHEDDGDGGVERAVLLVVERHPVVGPHVTGPIGLGRSEVVQPRPGGTAGRAYPAVGHDGRTAGHRGHRRARDQTALTHNCKFVSRALRFPG